MQIRYELVFLFTFLLFLSHYPIYYNLLAHQRYSPPIRALLALVYCLPGLNLLVYLLLRWLAPR